MRKHSRFFSKNQNNIKHLLGELALRDLKSEETKISEIVNRTNKEKATLRTRTLKTSVPKSIQKSRSGSFDKSITHHHLHIGKENNKQLEFPLNASHAGMDPNHKTKLEKMTTAKYQKHFWSTNCERSQEKSEAVIQLPKIYEGSKINSRSDKQSNHLDRLKQSVQSTKLDIIEEFNQYPSKLTKKPSINLSLMDRYQQKSIANLKK